MYLSSITIRNSRQFGDGDAALNVAFNSGVTALVGRLLRDAEREMSPGRGSRLSQILANVPGIGQGDAFTKSKGSGSFVFTT